MARDQITLADRARGQRKTLEGQLAEATASLVTLQNAADSAINAWQEWEASWLDSVRAAGYPDNVFADRVEVELEVIEEIDRHHNKTVLSDIRPYAQAMASGDVATDRLKPRFPTAVQRLRAFDLLGVRAERLINWSTMRR